MVFIKKFMCTVACISFVLSFAAVGYCADESLKVIPYPKNYDIISSGASSYQGVGNAHKSRYFTANDYFCPKKRQGLTLLEKFATYQQTREMSCAPSCALTVLHYFGNNSYDELELAEKIGTVLNFTSDGRIGTTVSQLAEFFKGLGWNVTSSVDIGDKNGITCESLSDFSEFIIDSLNDGIPVFVENMYMGGKWRVIIGYDTMNTPASTDDVIIFMNPYDIFDHKQDGYSVESAEYFYFTWMDIGLLPRQEQMQPWVKAAPSKINCNNKNENLKSDMETDYVNSDEADAGQNELYNNLIFDMPKPILYDVLYSG